MQLEVLRAQLLAAINEVRATGCQCGFEPAQPAPSLRGDVRLDAAAQGHSEELARIGFLDHVSGDGRSAFDRMRNAGFSWNAAAENIASGNASPWATLAQWVGSPGHCINLMSPLYTHAGIGHAVARDGQHYWTLDLAS